jgi:hypothetical protein
MPQGYEAMGWKRYKSGKCSYKGVKVESRHCPHKQHHHKRENDWDKDYGELTNPTFC